MKFKALYNHPLPFARGELERELKINSIQVLGSVKDTKMERFT